jgi:hypothetical protein
LLACGCSLPAFAATPSANQTAVLEPALQPSSPGRRTAVLFKVRFPTVPRLPAPLQFVRVFLPEGLTNLRLAWPNTLGCSRKRLLEAGPKGCPPRSQIGYGSALLGLEAGGAVVRKRAKLTVFVGPTNGAYVLNVLGELPGQLAVRFVFSEQLSAVSSPYSSGVEVNLAGSFVSSLLELTEVVGRPTPRHHSVQDGELKLYTPRHCPPGGYRWLASFTYLTGASETLETATPCR